MFRRSKPKHSAPTAPTFAQILADLETFEVEKPDQEPVRSLDTPSGHSSDASDSDASPVRRRSATVAPIGQWMSTLDTFRTDVDDLHRLRRQLQLYRSELVEARDCIATELADIHRRTEKATLSE